MPTCHQAAPRSPLERLPLHEVLPDMLLHLLLCPSAVPVEKDGQLEATNHIEDEEEGEEGNEEDEKEEDEEEEDEEAEEE